MHTKEIILIVFVVLFPFFIVNSLLLISNLKKQKQIGTGSQLFLIIISLWVPLVGYYLVRRRLQ
jgi:hypothetical protein